MKYISVFRLASFFNKKAQGYALSPGDGITSEDLDTLRIAAADAEKSALVLYNYIISAYDQSTDAEEMAFKNSVIQINDNAKNLNAKVGTFLDSDTTNRPSITSIDGELNALTSKYNDVRPKFDADNWMVNNASTEQAKAIDAIQLDIAFIAELSKRQKNVEANTDKSQPAPPELK